MSTKPIKELRKAEMTKVSGGDYTYTLGKLQKCLDPAKSELESTKQLAQSQFQARDFTAISNIMKAPHDTQKNAIGNMR